MNIEWVTGVAGILLQPLSMHVAGSMSWVISLTFPRLWESVPVSESPITNFLIIGIGTGIGPALVINI